jgi:hypothetical protein
MELIVFIAFIAFAFGLAAPRTPPAVAPIVITVEPQPVAPVFGCGPILALILLIVILISLLSI